MERHRLVSTNVRSNRGSSRVRLVKDNCISESFLNLHRCSSSLDTLQCLRETPFDKLYAVAFEGLEWFAAVDGTFIKEYPQISIAQGRLARVPILVGSNTDEGVSFGTTGVDTDEDCIAQLICICPTNLPLT